jgi:hypothetical protein
MGSALLLASATAVHFVHSARAGGASCGARARGRGRGGGAGRRWGGLLRCAWPAAVTVPALPTREQLCKAASKDSGARPLLITALHGACWCRMGLLAGVQPTDGGGGGGGGS